MESKNIFPRYGQSHVESIATATSPHELHFITSTNIDLFHIVILGTMLLREATAGETLHKLSNLHHWVCYKLKLKGNGERSLAV